MDANAIIIRFSLTSKMLFRAHWVLYARRILCVALIYLAVTVLGVLVMRGSDEYPLVITLLIVAWLLFAYSYLLYPWRSCKSWMQEPNMSGEREITVDNECVRGKTDYGEARYEWSMFSLFKERRDLFVLRLGKKQMFVIPKSSFENEDSITRFREILGSKI